MKISKSKGSLILFVSCLTFNPFSVDARSGCCSWHKGVSSSCRNGMIVCNDGTTSPSCTCEGGSTNSSSSNSSSSSSNYNNYYNTYTKIYGCTKSNSINYNANANTDDGSCIEKVYGCTDQNAYNYNPNANTDDGKCIAKVLGCTDEKADNYNKDANTEDNSCLYSEEKIVYKKIKYKTKYEYHKFIKSGKVIRKGKNGKKKEIYKITKNSSGEVVNKELISSKKIKKPVTKLISTNIKNK